MNKNREEVNGTKGEPEKMREIENEDRMNITKICRAGEIAEMGGEVKGESTTGNNQKLKKEHKKKK